jgi:zinc transporter ZupT
MGISVVVIAGIMVVLGYTTVLVEIKLYSSKEIKLV